MQITKQLAIFLDNEPGMLARVCHAHPTLNEAVKEAALAVDKRPIHVYSRTP